MSYYARDLKPASNIVIDKTNIFANPPLNIMAPLHHTIVTYSAGENYGQPVLPDMNYSYWEVLTLCTAPTRALQIAFECYNGTTRRMFMRRRHVDSDDYSQWGEWVDMALKSDVDSEAAARANVDSALQTNINNEVAARANADSAEATARANADSAEATARANADSALQTNINNEGTARTDADVAHANSFLGAGLHGTQWVAWGIDIGLIQIRYGTFSFSTDGVGSVVFGTALGSYCHIVYVMPAGNTSDTTGVRWRDTSVVSVSATGFAAFGNSGAVYRYLAIGN
jgi:hypothetical protein